MDILWPGFLILLGLIPLITAVYILLLRRRRRFAIRYSSLSLIREALPQQSRLRRHLPFVLFLLALAALIAALARPMLVTSVPSNQTTIILAIDVSLSMRQNDITPSRLEAAQAAALSFIQRQKSTTQIGIVAFSGFAELIQPPTTDQEALQAAIDSLTFGRRTAIGSGILKSIDAIAEIDKTVSPSTNESNINSAPVPVLKGVYAPDIIVLLTDGVSNAGISPLDAAQQAVDRGLRVYTIGYGTAQGGSFGFGGRGSQGDPLFGGGGSGRQQPSQGNTNDPFLGGFRRGIDEATLKKVADMTGGTYYSASSAGELNDIFRGLPTYLIMKHETTEISVLFAALGALLAGAAVLLAMIWHPLF